MDILKPLENGFTIYSKSGCINCRNIKKLLLEKKIFFLEVHCDEYLIENKEQFLLFIKNETLIDYKTFPMIFNNGTFIGGFNETVDYINKMEAFEENNDF